ncbi:MAG: putative oxidoreductase [Myxococcota bacterium]
MSRNGVLRVKNFLFGGLVSGPIFAHAGLAVLRVVAGLSMAFGHGLAKLPPPDRFVKIIAALDFPAPALFAWAAGMSEFVGGLLLAVGLMTRPAAATVAITMGIAVFGQHADDPFQARELATLYGAIALAFTLTGSGRLGLDRIVNRM